MRILDSRRLTGPSLLLDQPGAFLDVGLSGLDPETATAAWRAELVPLLDAIGWQGVTIATRAYPNGLQLAFTAPFDALYAATEVNEAAWHQAARALGGGETPRAHGQDPHDPDLEDAGEDGDGGRDFDGLVYRLTAAIAREVKPDLALVAFEAARRGVTLLADDRRVSVGLGSGSRAWPADETDGAAGRIPWKELREIPVALVTGTNGKTTTVRLLAAMARAAGRVAGVTSTDHVTVGDEIVAVGDYSGPNGARTVLRDRRVEMAFLEVARGGILRRGLPLPRAGAAVVTNVASDHLGEFGIFDLAALADTKMVVAKAIDGGGRVVLNADDALLLERGLRLRVPVIWFTLHADAPAIIEHLRRGGEACLLSGESLVYARGEERREIARVAEIPIAIGGAARHNIANALAAIGAAIALGIPEDAIRRGLKEFESTPAVNPGRGNVWDLGGATAIVDFAHNPHGLAALVEMSAALPARRRAIVIGQAGDRTDDDIKALARAAWVLRPERVFIKEMEAFLRGRERGAIPYMIERELLRCGAGAASLVRCGSEMEAVRAALVWADDGDLLLLTVHEARDQVVEMIERLAAGGWQPGNSIERA